MNEWVQGDSRRDILAKLVRSAGGEVNFTDTGYVLLKKYLKLIEFTQDGNDPQIGDLFLDLLRKVVRRKGGTPAWMDGEWQLLNRWRKINDPSPSCVCTTDIYGLWKLILQTESEPSLGTEGGFNLITEDGELIIL